VDLDRETVRTLGVRVSEVCQAMWAVLGGERDERRPEEHGPLDFEFSGPDAVVLNAAVSSQFTLQNVENHTFEGSFYHATLSVYLGPADLDGGVWFTSAASSSLFCGDPWGYPVVEPKLLASTSCLNDRRAGNGGFLFSRWDVLAFNTPAAPRPRRPL
jgi:hypothetical protein